MAFSPEAVANTILDVANKQGVAVTPMKLQKLAYYAHGVYLSNTNDLAGLVDDVAQAWEYGPVFPGIYHEFKRVGGAVIQGTEATKTHPVAGGGVSFTTPRINDEPESGDANFANAVVTSVCTKLGGFSGGQLSDKTHMPGTPWWAVRQQSMKSFGRIMPGLDIPNQMIADWFRSQAG